MTIFERIVVASQVEHEVLATIQKWMPTYLAEIERQTGKPAGFYPAVRSYSSAGRLRRLPEQQLPMVLVVSPGTMDEPVKQGRGYRARWTVNVAVITKGSTRVAANDNAKAYAAAVRALLLQHQGLEEEFSSGIGFVAESYDDFVVGKRSMAAGQIQLWVEVSNITTTSAGPMAPEPKADHLEPYEDWPIIEDATVTIELEAPE